MQVRLEAAPGGERSGDRIGRYKLLEQIGEGGCGIVFMAEQDEPVRRRVALKVIKPGMDSKSVIARFEAERQALAPTSPNSSMPGRRTPAGPILSWSLFVASKSLNTAISIH